MKTDFASNFFDLLETLDEATRQVVDAAFTRVAIGPGEVVYQQGDPADAVYIIAGGKVEAVTFSPDGKQSRSVAVMGRGEFFGDLAIFTDNPRLAMIRACEASKLLRLEKEAFLHLLKTVPALGFYFSCNLARRLHNTSVEAHHGVYAIDLSGNLARFDLLTIVQAISGMGHTGELALKNSANQMVGSFFFRQGRVEYARFGDLLGIEAIWQGFIESTSEGIFNFRSIDAPSLPVSDKDKIDLESTGLLLEGVGKRDAYQGLPAPLRRMEGRLTRISETLDWKAEENRPLAERIWSLIAEPQSLEAIWRQLDCSAISFLEIVMELGMNGQAELFIPEESLGVL